MMPVSDLRKLFVYEPKTGRVIWAVNRRSVLNGDEAGTVTSHGYRRINVRGQLMLAHRIAWALTHGDWPTDEIDHINGDRLDNRLSNLRLCTREQNARNSKVRAHNQSGLKGVKFDSRRGRYGARIRVNGLVHWLGSYPTAEKAHAAYCAAAERLHGEFARAA